MSLCGGTDSCHSIVLLNTTVCQKGEKPLWGLHPERVTREVVMCNHVWEKIRLVCLKRKTWSSKFTDPSVLPPAGQRGEVPHQSHLHLSPDQRLWGGRLPDAGPVLRRRWRGHQQLSHPEPAQVGGSFDRGEGFTHAERAAIWRFQYCFFDCALHSFIAALLSGVRRPVQALPAALRPASQRQRADDSGAEPEHAALQPGNLRESQQRQGESLHRAAVWMVPSFNSGAVAADGKGLKQDHPVAVAGSHASTFYTVFHCTASVSWEQLTLLASTTLSPCLVSQHTLEKPLCCNSCSTGGTRQAHLTWISETQQCQLKLMFHHQTSIVIRLCTLLQETSEILFCLLLLVASKVLSDRRLLSEKLEIGQLYPCPGRKPTPSRFTASRPHVLLPTGVLPARGPPRRRPAAVRRPGVPSDQLQQVQHSALPLLLWLRLQTPGGRLAAQDGPEGQDAQGRNEGMKQLVNYKHSSHSRRCELRTDAWRKFSLVTERLHKITQTTWLDLSPTKILKNTKGDERVVPMSSWTVASHNDEPQVWYQEGFYPSEPVFVPSPDAVDEDDGAILSVVLTPSQVRLLLDSGHTQQRVQELQLPTGWNTGAIHPKSKSSDFQEKFTQIELFDW